MAAKWVQKIKDRLAANPLHYSAVHLGAKAGAPLRATLEGMQVAPCVCAKCGGNGKKVPLYAVTNYGNEFNHCYVCGEKYT